MTSPFSALKVSKREWIFVGDFCLAVVCGSRAGGCFILADCKEDLSGFSL